MLVDSSVWLSTDHIELALEVVGVKELAVCGPVIYEVLRGARPGRFAATRRSLADVILLDDPTPVERYEEAAQLYRMLRSRGVTIRSPLDCVIAAVAMYHSVPVLHADHDFELIARHAPFAERDISSLVS